MTNGRPRRRSIFTGVLLILLGGVLLLHNLRGDFGLWRLLERWWPLLLVLWGLAKLYDHLEARRTGEAPPATITGGEIFLVIVLLLLVGGVGGFEWLRRHGEVGEMPRLWEQPYSFSEEVPAKAIPTDSRISIRTERGDITVRPEDSAEIRVMVKKSVDASSESEAQKRAQRVSVPVAEVSGAYEIQPQGPVGRAEGVRVDLEVHVPRKASVTARTARGTVQVIGLASSVIAEGQGGDIEVRDIGGDVSAEVKRGDVHIVGARGNVKLSGKGGQIEVADVKGDATVEGEFYGPIRIEKVAKGARFVSRRTDLTVTQLSGRIETGSGRLEITDAPGNVTLTTRKYDIVLDNVSGRIQIENRDGNIELRFPQPPREPVDVSNKSGGIELLLPASSAFEIQAESRSGEIDCEFPELAGKVTEERGTSKLEGKLGTKGPQLRLRTSYGAIRLRKGK